MAADGTDVRRKRWSCKISSFLTHEKARNLVRNISASPSVAKRAVPPPSTASYAQPPRRRCLNADPVWWWCNFTCDRLGWVSRLVPSDHDEAPEIDFASHSSFLMGEKSGSLATVLPDTRRPLNRAASPSCRMRRPLALHRSTKVWTSGSEYNSPRGVDSR